MKPEKIIINKILPFFIIIAGILIAAYPWISNYIYESRVSEVRAQHDKAMEDTDGAQLKKIREEAEKYNASLKEKVICLKDPFDADMANAISEEYESRLSVKGSPVMGYIEIPKIGVNLPIYHGTSRTVLEAGTGHMEGTSLPIGGESTHSVLTGHTGLSDKKLFTDLDRMEKGDLFFIKVLGETLCYRITEINVVLPDDTDRLTIKEGKDLCTLITCTPYGINDQRLLVTGERTEYTEGMEDTQKRAEYTSKWGSEYFRYVFQGIITSCIMVNAVSFFRKRKGRNKKNEKETSV